MAGDPIEVFGEGRMARDFTYIDDVVAGIVGALDHPPVAGKHRIMNIGNSSPVELMTMIDLLEQALGRNARKIMRPMQQGDVTATFADVGRLHALTGYNPRIRLDEGLRRFAAWFTGYHHG
jgi:UDP-glucuronate 4-epimerase